MLLAQVGERKFNLFTFEIFAQVSKSPFTSKKINFTFHNLSTIRKISGIYVRSYVYSETYWKRGVMRKYLLWNSITVEIKEFRPCEI